MATLFGYKYLGPGNKLKKGDPINEADLIAQIHDYSYEFAKTAADIRRADREAIKQFHNSREGTFGSILGEKGLQLKYGVESLFKDVLYPNMKSSSPRKPNIGQLLYAARQRAIYAGLQEARRNNRLFSLSDFKTTPDYQRILADHKKGGSVYVKIVNDNTPSTSKAAAAATGSGTGNDPDASGSKRPRTDSPADDSFNYSDFLRDFDTSVADRSSASLPEESASHMDVDLPEAGSSRGPNTGMREGASGPNIGASSTGAGGGNSISWLVGRPSNTISNLEFTKSRIFYSYGFATISLDTTEENQLIAGPMALIPVDFLPFYLTNAEYKALPDGSTIKKVWCTVKPLGTRTAFDTGTTLSGTATSEYIPIGMTAVGLNVDFNGKNCLWTTDATAPMVVTAYKNIVPSKMIEKYQDSHTLCVPRSISEYYGQVQNNAAAPVDKKKYPNYIPHTVGQPHLDKKIKKFLINSAITQTVVNYEYTPKCGLITKNKEHFLPWQYLSGTFFSEHYRSRGHVISSYQATDRLINGDIGLGKDKALDHLINAMDNTYIRQIENYGSFNTHTGASGYAAQPQVHVGIQAVPQLNVANEDTNFLNTCCYWQVDCGASVEFSLSSAFAENNLVSWPKEIMFIVNKNVKYTQGECLFGNTMEETGTVAVSNEELDDYDII